MYMYRPKKKERATRKKKTRRGLPKHGYTSALQKPTPHPPGGSLKCTCTHAVDSHY